MKTILNIKTDKALKLEAQKIAEEFGIPLGTILNAFLRQFVRNKSLNLDISYQPSKYLMDIIKESEEDLKKGNFTGPLSAEDFIKHLKTL